MRQARQRGGWAVSLAAWALGAALAGPGVPAAQAQADAASTSAVPGPAVPDAEETGTEASPPTATGTEAPPTSGASVPPPASVPAARLVPPRGLRSPVDLARSAAAQVAGISLEQVTVVDVQAAEWPDLSLGCPGSTPSVRFAQILVPGFIIHLDAAGTPLTYHTDAGRRAVLCDAPPPDPAGVPQELHD